MSKKKGLDWKEVGRVFSVFLNLFALIRDTFTAQGIGLEIIGWITGEGKDDFVEGFLKPLSERFLAAPCVVVVNENTIRVNLDAPPLFLYDGVTVRTNKGGGWVTMEKRADGLYVDGHKVILRRIERRDDDGKKMMSGLELLDDTVDLPVLHPNIMDALYKHNHLIPEDWKERIYENIRFMGVTFSESGRDSVIIRCLCWNGDKWSRTHHWLNDNRDNSPTAVLESN